ncbi:ATP-binding cassette domain-containing protein [Mycoplasma sp. 1654_15]|uniref:ATP-binding cassette domain-containing protein n=1 Tax=Mycoplasma sp. 1654_15 TaxID=2725994 RepID=UPI001449DD14|nr:ABC transporter ATP-binding protein [Mycoplasma sp. 1654_15]QJB71234.1 ABC transporter ATP-binding protein [Mycoplasma sp. 1654_15]
MSTKLKLIFYNIWNVCYVLQFLITSFIITVAPYYLFTFLQENNYINLVIASIILIFSFIISAIFSGYHSAIFAGFINILKLKNISKMIQVFNEINLSEYNKNSEGYYYSEIKNNNGERFEKYYYSLIELSKNVLYIIAILTFSFYQHWVLGITLSCMLILFFIFSLFIKPKLEKIYINKTESWNEFNENTTQILSYLPSLYTLNKKEKLKQLFSKNLDKNLKIYNSYLKTSKFFSLISENMNLVFKLVVSGVVIIYFGIFFKDDASSLIASVSIIVLVNILLENFFDYLSDTSENFLNFLKVEKAKAQIQDTTNIIPFKLNITEYKFSLENEAFSNIVVKDLTLKLENKTLYNNKNLIIEKNKKYIIKGSNGSGKSTLAKIFLGLEKNYLGNVLFNDKYEIKDIDFKSLNQYFNYLSNNTLLIEANIENNINLFDQNSNKNEISNLIEILNLSSIDKDKILGQEDDNDVSTGQMQRIALARNLYFKKDILIIDEGLSNIDKDNLQKALKILLEDANLTLIYISHHNDAEQESLFDQIIDLDK